MRRQANQTPARNPNTGETRQEEEARVDREFEIRRSVYLNTEEKEPMAKVKIRKTKNAKKNAKKSDNAIPTGKTLGLRMQETWVKIFTDNESAPKNKKLTDEQIAAFMLKEFPTADSKPFQLMREKKRWAVQGQRARYNRGGMTQGEAPAKASHRYDSDGNYDDTPFSGKKGVTMDKLNPRFLPETSKDSITNKKKKGAKTTKKVKVRLKK